MDELLEIIYDNYYNISNTLGFISDKEYVRFVYELRNVKKKNFNLNKYLENYKDNIRTKIIENIENGVKDSFFSEKEFLHFVYPLEHTLRRFQILYMITGDKEWKDIFGFEYKFFIDFICFIIYRIVMYNNYKTSVDKNEKNEYEELFPLSKNYFFTKEEFYKYFPEEHDSIDELLKLLSIEINNIKDINDVYHILKDSNKYVLYFIWDFIYHSYDLVESVIIDYYKRNKNEEKFYDKRGKEFEKYCYHKLLEAFPKSKVYRKLYYDDKTGNHEIDILLETQNEIVVFECKSSKFDIHTTKNDEELKKEFLRAFGRGYKTINDFNNYIIDNNSVLYSKKNNKKYDFDFKRKKVFYINITLHNIEYLQTSVQKIDKKLINPVGIYPINWNFIDFFTIMELTKLNPTPIMEYIHKRFKMLNDNKDITFDVDEIDVLGFLTDEQNERVYKMLIENSNNIDTRFIISNGIYREQVNNLFNEKMFNSFFDKG